jgi:hypothetical protein
MMSYMFCEENRAHIRKERANQITLLRDYVKLGPLRPSAIAAYHPSIHPSQQQAKRRNLLSCCHS